MPLNFGAPGQTPERRREEADKILEMLDGYESVMEDHEARFVFDCRDDRPVSPKMIAWLRDLKDKYL